MHEEYYTTEFEDDEARHWWYRARRHILKSVIRGISFPSDPRILDIGVATGANLYAVYPPTAILAGVEPSAALAQVANGKGDIPVYVGTAEELPLPVSDQTFDAVAMFDVLEHTENDRLVLANVAKRLKDGGVLMLTVPAYMLLWTMHDVAVGHYRRYRLRPLKQLLKSQGFGIERASYFNSLLLLPLAAFRLLRKLTGKKEVVSDTNFGGGILNQVLYCIFSLEKYLLKWLNFPAGVSILMIARKKTGQ